MYFLHQNSQSLPIIAIKFKRFFLSCSSEMDDGDDDSDSEPILGKWFAETLFPPGTIPLKAPNFNES
jgi:hypothetical protein